MTRASSTSGNGGSAALDNAPIIEQILKLRQEKAALLGYKSFAEQSLASKMAELEGEWQIFHKFKTRMLPHFILGFSGLPVGPLCMDRAPCASSALVAVMLPALPAQGAARCPNGAQPPLHESRPWLPAAARR